jgi:CubicO group peptidase (beta-lactamase class C family)
MRNTLAVLPLLGFLLLAAPGCAQQQDPAAARVDSILRAAEKSGFSGAVLVARDGNVVFERGYGMADRARRIKFGPNTVVQIGSNTKDFTAVALLQIVQSGNLRLTDSLPRFFKNVPADKRGITIGQLLEHRSGMPGSIGPDFEPLNREQLIARAMSTPLRFKPGTSQEYSNTGYSLLAAVIEVTSGLTYDQWVHDFILAPTGLTRTGFLLPRFAARDLAHGYRDGEDRGTMLSRPHASDGPYWNLRGNGGMLSTVGEMLKFYRVLYGTDQLLKPATRDIRFRPDQPVILAGSDMVNYFMYRREPAEKLEMIIASTSTDVKAPRLQGQIAAAFGLQSPGGPDENAAYANAPMITLPTTPAGRTVSEYLESFNSGDQATMRRFFTERFLPGIPGAPSTDERLSRYRAMSSDLGELTPIGFEEPESGVVVLRARSEKEGVVVIRFTLETSEPYRVKSVQIRVGG